MIRRLPVLGALVAVSLSALSLAACSSTEKNAAKVGDATLTVDQLDTLMNGNTKGEDIRNVITNWIVVEILGGDTSQIKTTADLQTAVNDANDALVADHVDEAATEYEKGLDASFLCLAAIPVASDTNPDDVLAEMQGGLSFADALQKYSSEDALKQSGGVLADQSGNECLARDSFTADLLKAMADAGAEVGTPVSVTIGTQGAIILMRPWDELSDTAKQSAAKSIAQAAGMDKVSAAGDVWVNSRYGKWDSVIAKVVPSSEPLTTTSTTPTTGS